MVYAAEKRRGDACDNVTAACLRWDERTPPLSRLRAPAARNVDADALWREAAARVAARRASDTAPPAEGHRDVAQRIEELEAYLRRFEPKS